MTLRPRLAVPSDIAALDVLIAASVEGLQASDYSEPQRRAALTTVFGVDTQLIADGTYFVVEEGSTLVGCGGWSFRRTLHGSDRGEGRDATRLHPGCDAARIRAFFVHPGWARRGIASLILTACEQAARAAGFTRMELAATLPGAAFYRARGYTEAGRAQVPLPGADALPIVHMHKHFLSSGNPNASP